jgi:hypothetical protein
VTPDRSVAVLAHGLGGSTALPIPLSYALIGAAWALSPGHQLTEQLVTVSYTFTGLYLLFGG